MKLSQETAERAYWRHGGYCENCSKAATDNHHVFSQQKWPELGDTVENIVALCRKCHEDHTNASHRLPRAVCRHAEALASTDRMKDYLDRVYGR